MNDRDLIIVKGNDTDLMPVRTRTLQRIYSAIKKVAKNHDMS